MYEFSTMKGRLMATISGVSVATTLLIGGFFICEQMQANERSLTSYREDLEATTGRQLKEETQIAVSIIEECRNKELAGALTSGQAKKEAADRVRDLRYDDGKGYFWIDTEEGVNVVLLGRDTEGQSRIDATDPDGNHYIRDMIENGKKSGGGLTKLMFAKPGETTPLPKLNYTVSYQPYGWVVGTGVWIDEIDEAVAAREKELDENTRESIMMAVGVMAAILLGCIALARYIGANIAKPIQKVTEHMEVMGTGDFRLEGNEAMELVSLASRPDELGTMAHAMLDMNDRVRGLMKNVAETAEYLAAASEELTSTAEQAAEVSQSIANSVVNVAGSCSEQFDEVETANEHTKQLNENMEHFRAHLDATSENVRQTSMVAAEGGKNVQSAVSSMQAIEKNVGDIAVRIEDLGENSKEIGDIVETISTIANQTNLLALNAAIEAASAGEHGRGFSVVADEVRKLAEQSQDAAGEIASRIIRIQSSTNDAVEAMHAGVQEVVDGMQTVQSTGTSFHGIIGMVDDVAESSKEMQDSVRKLTDSIREISSAISTINEKSRAVADEAQTVSASTEEETASMNEIAGSSRKLAEQAQELQNAIAVFKI